jgi:hypothetical protein
MRYVDTAIALRIVWLLVTPVANTKAYELGLIDADGKTVRKATTSEEKNSTSMLHRLVWNIKRMIGLVPGGSTKVGSLAAAYLLMKEAVDNKWDEATLNEQCVLRFNTLCESNVEELDELMDRLVSIEEDAPVNAAGAMPDAGGVAKTDKPLSKIARRKQFKTIELPE